MRKAFLDPRHEAAFTTDGYVLLDLLTPADAAHLLSFYQPFRLQHEDGFTTSVLTDDLAARQRIHDELCGVFHARLLPVLDDYAIVVASYAVKQANSEVSSVGLHQDFSFVDERFERGISFWSPLVEVDAVNGYLGVARGTHPFNTNFREPCSLPYPDLADLIEREYMTYLPMRPGQVLLMDNRLFHASPPNQSNRPRVVAAGIAVPRESRLLCCHRDLDGDATVLEIYEVPADYYLRHAIGSRPSEGSLLATVPRLVADLTAAQLQAHFAPAPAVPAPAQTTA